MKKSRFSEEQMVKILRETDRGPVSAVAKKHGISEQMLPDMVFRVVSFPPTIRRMTLHRWSAATDPPPQIRPSRRAVRDLTSTRNVPSSVTWLPQSPDTLPRMKIVIPLLLTFCLGLSALPAHASTEPAATGSAAAAPPPPAEQPSAAVAEAAFGKGATIRRADDMFSLNIRARMQARATLSDYDNDESPVFGMQIRRMRTVFQGNALGPKLTYYIQLAFSNLDMESDLRSPLRDAY